MRGLSVLSVGAICAAVGFGASPAAAVLLLPPACPGAGFPYTTNFGFPIAPEGFAADCVVPFGYLRIDARTGTARVLIETSGLVDFDPGGQLARLPLNHDHGPILDVSHPAGLISSLTTPAGEGAQVLTLTFAYSGNGQLARVTTGQSPPVTITFTRDGAGRVTRIQSSTGEYATFGYAGATDRVASYSDLGGDNGAFSYAANGALTQATETTTLSDPVYTFTYGAGGALASWSDGTTTRSLTTDTAGDVTSVSDGTAISYLAAHRPGTVQSGASTIASFAYDALDRLTTATGAGGQFFAFSYGPRGFVSTIADQSSDTFRLSYDAYGRPTQIAGPGGEVATISYLPAPTIQHQSAHHVSTTRATIQATIDPNALATTYRIQYGRTTAYRHSTRLFMLPAGGRAVAIAVVLAHLTPGSRYHYRLVAISPAGTSYGLDRTFKTAHAHRRR